MQHGLGGLPAPAKNFQSPAAGGQWQPDYAKYAPELGHQVRRAVQGAEKAIFD